MTGFTTLVGFPSAEPAAAGGVLLVPGTVIPLGGDGAAVRRGVVERSLAFSSAVERLWSTFRLDPARQIQKGANLPARVGAALELPTVEGSAVAIAATLLGFNERAATYRVVFREGAKVVADSTVVVDRGGRAVVGGLDGPAAPYLFVFVEPEPAGVGATPSRVEKGLGLTEPVAVTKVPPAYPEEATQGQDPGHGGGRSGDRRRRQGGRRAHPREPVAAARRARRSRRSGSGPSSRRRTPPAGRSPCASA